MIQQTLVLIKPDGVQKQLVGEIIKRFESSNLKVQGMKMVWPDENLAKTHYPLDEEWAKALFEKNKTAAEKENRKTEFTDYLEFGKNIQNCLIKYVTESPVIAMVIQGDNAIEQVRKITGATEPKSSAPGTIRGDLVPEESYEKADAEKRAVRNLIHASDSTETAEKEISLWFSQEEIHNY